MHPTNQNHMVKKGAMFFWAGFSLECLAKLPFFRIHSIENATQRTSFQPIPTWSGPGLLGRIHPERQVGLMSMPALTGAEKWGNLGVMPFESVQVPPKMNQNDLFEAVNNTISPFRALKPTALRVVGQV